MCLDFLITCCAGGVVMAFQVQRSLVVLENHCTQGGLWVLGMGDHGRCASLAVLLTGGGIGGLQTMA